VGFDAGADGLVLHRGAGAPLVGVLPGRDVQHLLAGQVADDQADPPIAGPGPRSVALGLPGQLM
jgi:hypothetical protein